MEVREATAADRTGALNVLDGAALSVDHDRFRTAIAAGDVLVALADGGSTSRASRASSGDSPDDEGTVLGALVLDGERIAAVAVRRRRRGQGVGTALVEAAADRRRRLVADFDEGVRPFYESLGVDVEAGEDAGRYRGVRSAA